MESIQRKTNVTPGKEIVKFIAFALVYKRIRLRGLRTLSLFCNELVYLYILL